MTQDSFFLLFAPQFIGWAVVCVFAITAAHHLIQNQQQIASLNRLLRVRATVELVRTWQRLAHNFIDFKRVSLSNENPSKLLDSRVSSWLPGHLRHKCVIPAVNFCKHCKFSANASTATIWITESRVYSRNPCTRPAQHDPLLEWRWIYRCRRHYPSGFKRGICHFRR